MWALIPPDVLRVALRHTREIRAYVACSAVCGAWATALTPALREEAEIELLIREMGNGNILFSEQMYPRPTPEEHAFARIEGPTYTWGGRPAELARFEWFAGCEGAPWMTTPRQRDGPEHGLVLSEDCELLFPEDHKELPANLAELIKEFLGGSIGALSALSDLADSDQVTSWHKHLEAPRERLQKSAVTLGDALGQAAAGTGSIDLMHWDGGENDNGLDRTPRQRRADTSHSLARTGVFRIDMPWVGSLSCREGGTPDSIGGIVYYPRLGALDSDGLYPDDAADWGDQDTFYPGRRAPYGRSGGTEDCNDIVIVCAVDVPHVVGRDIEEIWSNLS
jgi:hypothetical protein